MDAEYEAAEAEAIGSIHPDDLAHADRNSRRTRVEEVAPDIWEVTLSHDDSCPWFRQLEWRWR